jgi:hypothetical protein
MREKNSKTATDDHRVVKVLWQAISQGSGQCGGGVVKVVSVVRK